MARNVRELGQKTSAMTRTRMQRTEWNRRILASTRGRILALLRTGNRTVNELATALDLTDNAVRAHLLSLERDGIVQHSGTRPGRHKPSATYGLSAGADYIFPIVAAALALWSIFGPAIV